jgi:mannose-1-phosphate guanylyltransferase
MKQQIFNPVIMAGGVGSRLWPLSRASMPKQFQQLLQNPNGYSMLQQTATRLQELSLGQWQVICNQDHRFLAAEQLRVIENAIGPSDIVLEPCGRNTAPAVLVAALRLLDQQNDEPMVLLAADHAILQEDSFIEALQKAHTIASNGMIVTLGITPTFACSGYGYIRQGAALSQGHVVAEFVEKPVLAVANKYIASGDYLWNSGMFIARPSVVVSEAEAFCPELLGQCKQVVDASFADLDFIRLPEREFSDCENISIDYAIMEHTQKAAVVPMDCGWSDVGDLGALKQANQADDVGNVFVGDVEAIDTSNCLVHSESKLVATLGVNNLAIVETKDALLVADLSQSQQVKEVVKKLKDRDVLDHHREVFRPWGSYDSIDAGSNYQVKRITVKPGAKLSLQRHQKRAEHWVVVQGTATVHLDGEMHTLEANNSIYIPRQAVHSLMNNTAEFLHLIEVQSGSYLGEDDIERLEDIYGRN